MALRFFLEQPSYLRTLLSDFLHQQKKEPFWGTVFSARKQDLFQVSVFVLVLFALLLRTEVKATTLLLFCFSLIIGYLLLLKENTKSKRKINKTEKKIKRLERTLQRKRNIFENSPRSLLHKNLTLVELFSSLYVFAKFDRKNYKAALIHANQLIRIYESSKIGTVLPSQTISLAEKEMRDCMNAIHSMIHSLPSTSVGDFRFQVTLILLQEGLQKIVDNIKKFAKYQYLENGPDIYNPPPSTRSGPWPNPLEEKDYNPYYEQYY